MDINEVLGIDVVKTGENIRRLRLARGLTVADVQHYIGYTSPNTVYDWERGDSLPLIDNFYLLSLLLDTNINDIIVPFKSCKGTNYSRVKDDVPDPKYCISYLPVEAT